MNITYENFDWQIYVKINLDLNYISNKDDAWHHWIKHGISEERPLSNINNTNTHNGRLGNLFFINMALHFIALKTNLQCRYKYISQFEKLGIHLFSGNNTYHNNLILTDTNFLDIIKSSNKTQNIIIDNDNWFQTTDFSLFLKKYFNMTYPKFKIINNNIFKNRYDNNNDLFIHIRLGDVTNNIGDITKYYDKMLLETTYVKGYISSDSIENEICKYFIDKYNLMIVNACEIDTIMFASTCNNIILSGGTFSWLIGFFAFYSTNICYPNMKERWYGEIFSVHDWNCVNY